MQINFGSNTSNNARQVSGADSAQLSNSSTRGGSPSVQEGTRIDIVKFELLFPTATTGAGSVTAGPSLNSLSVDQLKDMTPEQQYQLGIRYLNGIGVDQNFTRAHQCLLLASGSPAALFTLGEMYAGGLGPQRNLTKALDYYQRASMGGNANASAALAHCYAQGLGVAKDFRKMMDHYELAVKQGNSVAEHKLRAAREAQSQFLLHEKAALAGDRQAQYQLGCCFVRGEGVDQNPAQALVWWVKAAKQGSPEAMFALGQSCESQNQAKLACEWYLKAAQLGNAEAQFRLGQCHDIGTGVARDKSEAMKWYEKAGMQGLAKAQVKLAHSYESLGSMVDDKFVSAPIEVRVKALDWYKKAADQGDLDGLKGLYAMVFAGDIVPRDLNKALEALESLAGLGSVEAARWLADGHLTGEIGVQAPGKAMKWYEQWAEIGGAEVKLQLASYFESGTYSLLQADPEKAFFWTRSAALDGNSLARHKLGTFYEQGYGVEKDLAKAFEWYQKAADGGRPEHQYALGLCYDRGTGVTQDGYRALELMRRAAGQECAEALLWLKAWEQSAAQ